MNPPDTKTPDPLERFRAAQLDRYAGYSTALGEIRAGRKTSHWVWYIFPQLRGLGHSSMAERYGIASAAEAADYLRDPVLGKRLAEITRALEGHVCAATNPRSLDQVLGGLDAMKVVSSLTLFVEVARGLGEPWVTSFRESAERVLSAAARDGRPRCAFTLSRLAEK